MAAPAIVSETFSGSHSAPLAGSANRGSAPILRPKGYQLLAVLRRIRNNSHAVAVSHITSARGNGRRLPRLPVSIALSASAQIGVSGMLLVQAASDGGAKRRRQAPRVVASASADPW